MNEPNAVDGGTAKSLEELAASLRKAEDAEHSIRMEAAKRQRQLREEADAVYESEGWERKMFAARKEAHVARQAHDAALVKIETDRLSSLVGKRVWKEKKSFTRFGNPAKSFRAEGIIEVWSSSSRSRSAYHGVKPGTVVVRLLKKNGEPGVDFLRVESGWFATETGIAVKEQRYDVDTHQLVETGNVKEVWTFAAEAK